jgi:hypothetical protein
MALTHRVGSAPPASSSLPRCPVCQDFVPTCATSGRGHLIFGDARGVVKIINRDMEESRFQAFEASVLHMQQLKKTNVLVSIGNDGGQHNTTIKIWSVSDRNHTSAWVLLSFVPYRSLTLAVALPRSSPNPQAPRPDRRGGQSHARACTQSLLAQVSRRAGQ